MILFIIFVVCSSIILFGAFQMHIQDVRKLAIQKKELVCKDAEIKRLCKLVKIQDDYNETVHNMTYSLKAIEQIALEYHVDEIREIVEKLTGNLAKGEIIQYSNHCMINRVLSDYVTKAEKMKLEFDVYVEPGCVVRDIKDNDIVSIFSNVLDNALEAANKVENGTVVFRMFMHQKGKMCIVKVANDYMEEIVEKNGVILSTKREKGIHGVGLSSVRKTLEKYAGSFNYYTEHKKFCAVLIFPVS